MKSVELFKVLSSPIRVRMLRALYYRTMVPGQRVSYTELMDMCGLDENSCGQFNYHLNRLIEAKLVRKVDGKYAITPYGSEVYANIVIHTEFVLDKISALKRAVR